jgi:hypothetical protein
MAFTTPGTAVAGEVLTAAFWNEQVRDNLNVLRAIINIKSASVTTPITLGTVSQTWFDVTGLSVSITPTAASSKILIFGFVNFGSSTTGNLLYMQIVRDSTAVGIGTGSTGSRSVVTNGGISPHTDTNQTMTMPYNFLDTPNTTSQITYKIQGKQNNSPSTIYANRTGADSDTAFSARPISTITAIEVPA